MRSSRAQPRVAARSLILALAFIAGGAHVTTLRYDLEHNASENGFGFSGLHWAQACQNMCGPEIGDLDGSLFFQQTGTAYDIVRSSVLTASNGWSLEIVGGRISGLDGSEQLDYVMSGLFDNALTGSFRFAPGHTAGAANYIDDAQLRLWGYTTPGQLDNVTPIGMDLGARAVPEPSTALLFGIGTMIAAAHHATPRLTNGHFSPQTCQSRRRGALLRGVRRSREIGACN